jgi:hypothetical protein
MYRRSRILKGQDVVTHLDHPDNSNVGRRARSGQHIGTAGFGFFGFCEHRYNRVRHARITRWRTKHEQVGMGHQLDSLEIRLTSDYAGRLPIVPALPWCSCSCSAGAALFKRLSP